MKDTVAVRQIKSSNQQEKPETVSTIVLNTIEKKWWERLLKNRIAVLASIVLMAILASAILAPVLPITPPNEINARQRLYAPGEGGYVLGSDTLGRDILSRLIWGGRVSLKAGFIASSLALVIGVTIGLFAGFYGGWIDDILMRLTDIALAFPVILLAIAIIAALGSGINNAMIAAAIAGYPLYARVVRGSALSVREMEYVMAARSIGSNDLRIMLVHLLPNMLAPIIVTFTLDVGNMIILTSSLSFLGMGSQPPTSDWGNMISSGRTYIQTAPHLVIVPGVIIFIVVLCLNLIGDALRDTFDPKLKE